MFSLLLNALIIQHAEDYELAKSGMMNDGIISTKLGLQGIPDVAEKIIIERDLSLLEEYKCRYHISQISSAKSIDIIKKKKEYLKFSCGVSINNLSQLKKIREILEDKGNSNVKIMFHNSDQKFIFNLKNKRKISRKSLINLKNDNILTNIN